MKNQIIVLTLVQGDSQIAGWNESAKVGLPQYFSCFDGPTFYQGKTRTDAINTAIGGSSVHPHEWP